MSLLKLRLITPDSISIQPSIQLMGALTNCTLTFLFLADKSGIRCGLLLLWPICFKAQCVGFSEKLSCISWLFELLLPFLSYQIYQPVLLQPLTSFSPTQLLHILYIFWTMLCRLCRWLGRKSQYNGSSCNTSSSFSNNHTPLIFT